MSHEPGREHREAHSTRQWVWNVLVSVDQFVNTLTGGDPDETLSGRSRRAKEHGRWWGRVMCRLLNWIDPGHCDRAEE